MLQLFIHIDTYIYIYMYVHTEYGTISLVVLAAATVRAPLSKATPRSSPELPKELN